MERGQQSWVASDGVRGDQFGHAASGQNDKVTVRVRNSDGSEGGRGTWISLICNLDISSVIDVGARVLS